MRAMEGQEDIEPLHTGQPGGGGHSISASRTRAHSRRVRMRRTTVAFRHLVAEHALRRRAQPGRIPGSDRLAADALSIVRGDAHRSKRRIAQEAHDMPEVVRDRFLVLSPRFGDRRPFPGLAGRHHRPYHRRRPPTLSPALTTKPMSQMTRTASAIHHST